MKSSKKPLSKKTKKIRRERKIEQKKKYQFIFINGKQVKVKKEPEIDGMPVDDFIKANADPIWLHQNELWHLIETEQNVEIEDQKHDEDERRFSRKMSPQITQLNHNAADYLTAQG